MTTKLKKWLVRFVLPDVALLGLIRAKEALWTRRLSRENQADVQSDDGLPVPPARLIVLVGGVTTVPAFLLGGIAVARVIREMLATEGVSMQDLSAILDFGCGCGRVTRQWRDLPPAVEVHGSDYNASLVDWCQQNLTFGSFKTNALAPPLDYAAATFGLVYAFSVFTHLPIDLQMAWFDELARVVRPDGYLLFTAHGESYADQLTDEERTVFDSGELVVRYGGVAGTNLCATFHPDRWVRTVLARDWQLVRIAPKAAGQDFVLLKRRVPGSAAQVTSARSRASLLI